MHTLIPREKITGGRDIVAAHRLHTFLEVPTKFTDWWTRLLADHGCFVLNTNFCSNLSKSTGGRPAQDFVTTGIVGAPGTLPIDSLPSRRRPNFSRLNPPS